MIDYEQTLKIDTDPDTVFDFVCDVSNMPKYLPTARHAETIGEERVRVQGEARGDSYDDECFLRIDPVEFHMEWRSDGASRCQGWLAVENAGDGMSELTVHLSLTPGPEMSSQNREALNDSINQHLRQALLSIKNIVETHGVTIEG